MQRYRPHLRFGDFNSFARITVTYMEDWSKKAQKRILRMGEIKKNTFVVGSADNDIILTEKNTEIDKQLLLLIAYLLLY